MNTTQTLKQAIKEHRAFVSIDTEDSDYLVTITKFHPAIDAAHFDLVETSDGELYAATSSAIRIY